MKETKLGRVKKNPPLSANEDLYRYKFLSLRNSEPDLGVPQNQYSILSSDKSGNRNWLTTLSGISANEYNISVDSNSVFINTSQLEDINSTNLQQVLEDIDKFVGARGPQGFDGDRGPPGGQGEPGDDATEEVKGPDGFRGFQGRDIVGNQGSIGIGSRGERGFQGPQGEPGEDGEPGSTSLGEQGERGFQGDIGLPGKGGEDGQTIIGDVGPRGFQGKQGFPGVEGQDGQVLGDGSKGPQGPSGFKGNQGYIGKPNNTFEILNNNLPLSTMYLNFTDNTNSVTDALTDKSLTYDHVNDILSTESAFLSGLNFYSSPQPNNNLLLGYYSIRYDNNTVYLDVNIGGTTGIKTITLGSIN